MAEIKAFKVTNLPNDNHYPFNLNVLDYAQDCEPVSTQFEMILTPYRAAVEHENDVMHPQAANDLTPEIAQTDTNRDTTYYIIEHLIDVYLHYPDGQDKTDAEKIEKYLKINKVNPQAQYDRETGQIIQLVEDLEANCVAEMERLQLTAHVAKLKQLNQHMYELLQERDKDLADKMLKAVRTARRNVDDLYHRLIWAVNAFAFVNPEPYLPFIRNVNQTIDRLNLQVFKITGSSADKDQVDSPDNGESTDGEGGEGGETGGGETTTTYTATFRFRDNTEVVRTGAAGSALDAPSPSSGCHWDPTPPAEMPAENTTYTEVSDPSTGGTEL